VLQGLTVFIGPLLLKYFHPRIVIALGSILGLGGILASSYVTSFPAFALLFGGYYGFAIGIIYLVPLICSWEYFPNRKGMISGIIIGGFGFGAFIFGFISFAIVNPDNNSPTIEVPGGKIFSPLSDEALRVPGMIRTNVAIWS
jgi:MFS family permease